MTNTDIILRFLQESGLAWYDDCLSDKTGITPRQQINQSGSKLRKNGIIFGDRA